MNIERGNLFIVLRPHATGPDLEARETPDGVHLRMRGAPGAAMNLTPEYAEVLETFLREARETRLGISEQQRRAQESRITEAFPPESRFPHAQATVGPDEVRGEYQRPEAKLVTDLDLGEQ